jgi:hypothetical protein
MLILQEIVKIILIVKRGETMYNYAYRVIDTLREIL